MKYRILANTMRRALRSFPATVITGPRQSGKTTLVQDLLRKTHRYVNLEDPDTRIRAREDPRGFLDRHPTPLILDEIQYVPELLPYIKTRIDERRKPGQWVLTGSQNFTLMRGVSESLAGRVAVLSLLPFSFAERIGRGEQSLDAATLLKRASRTHPVESKRASIAQVILRGHYPEVASRRSLDKDLWCGSYIATYLERDIRNLSQVGDLSQFERFLRLCATRTGQMLNVSELAREIGVSGPTAQRWISLLETGYQVYLLYPYYRNIGKRLVKSPKLYFNDTALACYLLGLRDEEALLRSPHFPHLFETLVITDFWKRFLHFGQMPSMYYLRTRDGMEVDLLLEIGEKLHLFEIKSGATISPSEPGEKKDEEKKAPEPEHGKTAIFLDALDQLNPTDNARMLYWMPRDLKPNVKLIVSVLETEEEPPRPTTDNRQPTARLPDDPFSLARRIWPQSLVPVGTLDPSSGANLLDFWLKDAGRKLQDHQRAAVLGKFGQNGMPLYLKLASEEARRWHSYDPVPNLPDDTSDLIRFMLDRLSRPENHGEMLVSRALGYIAAAKNGLTEDELLDVLARDDEYWQDFCEHLRQTEPTLARTDRAELSAADLKGIAPQDRRLPVIVWSRLYHDLERYLSERSADATTLFSFYHRQVAEVVESKYLPPERRLIAHERLATYFASQDYWAESLEAQRARAKRLPPTPRPANIRKVVELPYHRLEAAKLGGKDDPKSKYWDDVADLLTDWQFLEAKAEADPNFREEESAKPAADPGQ